MLIMMLMMINICLGSKIKSVNDDFIDIVNKTGTVYMDHTYDIDMSKWTSVIPKFKILIGKGLSTSINLIFSESSIGKLSVFESLESISLYHIYFNITIKNNTNDISEISLSDSICGSMRNSYIYDMHINFDIKDVIITTNKPNSIFCNTIISSTLFHIGIYFNSMKIILEKEGNNFGMIGYNISSSENKEISGIFIKGKELIVKSDKNTLFGSWFYVASGITLSNSLVDIETVLLEGNTNWSMGINIISSSIEIFKSFINIRKSLKISCDNACNYGSLINSAKYIVKINECWIRLIIDKLNSNNLYFGGYINEIKSNSFEMKNSNIFISFTNTHIGYDYIKFGMLLNRMDITYNSNITNCVSIVGIYSIISLQFPIYDVYSSSQDQVSKYIKLSSVYFNENGVVKCIYKPNVGIEMKELSYIESETKGYVITSDKKSIYYIGMPYYENDRIIDEQKSFESIDMSFVNDNIIYSNKTNIYIKSYIPEYNLDNNDYEFEIYLFPKDNKYYDDVLIVDSECADHIETNLQYPLALYHPRRDNYYKNNKISIKFSKLNAFEILTQINHSFKCRINGYVNNKLVEKIDIEIKIHQNEYLPLLILSIIQVVLITVLFVVVVYKDRGIEFIKKHSENEKRDIPLYLCLMFLFMPIIIGMIVVLACALAYVIPVAIFSPVYFIIFVGCCSKECEECRDKYLCFFIVLAGLAVVGIILLYLLTDFWDVMNSNTGTKIMISDGLSCIIGISYSLILLIGYGIYIYFKKEKREDEIPLIIEEEKEEPEEFFALPSS